MEINIFQETYKKMKKLKAKILIILEGLCLKVFHLIKLKVLSNQFWLPLLIWVQKRIFQIVLCKIMQWEFGNLITRILFQIKKLSLSEITKYLVILVKKLHKVIKHWSRIPNQDLKKTKKSRII